LNWEQVFEPYAAIPLPVPPTPRTDRLSVVAIDFDKQGMVTTEHAHGSPLRMEIRRVPGSTDLANGSSA
jgi:hypothetical protein